MLNQTPDSLHQQHHSVSQLNALARHWVESGFPQIYVYGELSNLSSPRSGHLYFSLKDAFTQLRCVMFRTQRGACQGPLQDGQQVLIQGKLSIYEARGDIQIYVESLSILGDGLLRQQFEQLKQRLALEGLFDPMRRKTFPPYPRHIAVLTSATGAAVQDILTTLNRRFPVLRVTVVHSDVQGQKAIPDLLRAFDWVERHASECDALILARGGGSLEDLQAFNDERLARAVFACPLPVVTGIGHETDTTIADYVADHRAPTPTGAAEWVSPDQREIKTLCQQNLSRLMHAARKQLSIQGQTLHQTVARLRHPEQHIAQLKQTIDEATQRLGLAAKTRLNHLRQTLDHLRHSLTLASPQSTLERGYTMLRHQDQTPITSVHQVRPGEVFILEFKDGCVEVVYAA